jgi:ribosomal protein L17
VGPAGSEAEKLVRFKDELNDELDAIQTLINHNQIAPADRRLRDLVRRVEGVITSAGKALHKKMQEAEKRFKAAKRGITEPAIPMDDVVAMYEIGEWSSDEPPPKRV